MDLMTILNTVLPIVIMGFFIYFALVAGSCIYGTIKLRKQDKSMQSCMNTKGNILYGIMTLLFVVSVGGAIYSMVTQLSKSAITLEKFLVSLRAFNLTTVYTVIYAMKLQDYVHVSKKYLLMGNRLFEFRRMKKVGYPKKHKCSFIYGQKEYIFSTRFLNITQLKQALAKVRQ